MTNKVYDGSNWKQVNALKLYDGSNWKNAFKSWIWDGFNWKQWYPEYPVNTASPVVSGNSTQGNNLSVTDGSWNSNLAYSPVSYQYQWIRGVSDISGATNSTYYTVTADVGNEISCRVTAQNNRGSTPALSSNSILITSAAVKNLTAPVTSGSTYYNEIASVSNGTWEGNPDQYSYQWYNASNGSPISGATSSSLTIPASIVGAAVWCLVTATNTTTGYFESAYSNSFIALPKVTGLSLSDATIVPTAPSFVTVNVTGSTTADVSWGAGTNFSFYDGYSTLGSLINKNDSTRTANITGGTAGSAFTVYIGSWNYDGKVTGSWNSIPGSYTTVTYYIYVDGAFITTTTSNSYTYTKGNTSGTTIFQVVPYVGGSGGTGQGSSINLSTKFSGYTSGSGTFQVPAPGTPTSPSATTNSSSQITFSWSAPTTGGAVASYAYYYSTVNSTPSTSTSSGSTTNTSVPITGLSPSTPYYFWVRAVNVSGTSNWTNVVTATTSADLPTTPTSLSATTNRSDGINLTFSGSSGATGYDLWWNYTQTSTPSSGATADFPNKPSPFLDSTIVQGDGRYYWVRGVNAAGTSAWYPATNGVYGYRTLPAPATPTGILAIRYTATACNFTTVSWTASSGATSYDIYRTTLSTYTPTSSDTPTGSTTATAWDYASSSSAYYFVRAVGSGGTSAWSSRITPTTSAAAC